MMNRKDHPLYQTWKSMRQRCSNPNHTFYHCYGGKGIKVCPEWDDFWRFVKDVGERPEGCTLDRKETDKDYEPSNVRWATLEEQNGNRSISKVVWFKGKKRHLAEVARKTGVHPRTLSDRLAKGQSLKAALCVSA